MKFIVISIIVAILIIFGAIFATRNTENTNQIKTAVEGKNVNIVDGVQIIEITARGGYIPMKSVAQADIPTIIKFNTSGTFDCSSSVRIPSLDITQYLKLTGETDIDIGKPKIGTLQGSCAMGMYPFEIEFKS